MADRQARRAFVLTRRSSGATFAEIGRELGISSTRASQLHSAAIEALERRPPDVYVTSETSLCELPLCWRTRRILTQVPELTVGRYLGVDKSDRHSQILRLPRFGRRQLNELEELLEASPHLVNRMEFKDLAIDHALIYSPSAGRERAQR